MHTRSDRGSLGLPAILALAVSLLVIAAIVGLFLYEPGNSLVSSLGSRAAQYGTCPKTDTVEFLAATERTIAEFNDQAKRAAATSRIALSSVVGEMQTLRRGYTAVPRPKCAEAAGRAVADGMDETIEAYLAFMREDEGGSGDHFRQARAHFDEAGAEMRKLREGLES